LSWRQPRAPHQRRSFTERVSCSCASAARWRWSSPRARACPCCGGTLGVIGEDRSERLDKVSAKLKVFVPSSLGSSTPSLSQIRTAARVGARRHRASGRNLFAGGQRGAPATAPALHRIIRHDPSLIGRAAVRTDKAGRPAQAPDVITASCLVPEPIVYFLKGRGIVDTSNEASLILHDRQIASLLRSAKGIPHSFKSDLVKLLDTLLSVRRPLPAHFCMGIPCLYFLFTL
jgi:hypothetical protein